MDSVALALFRFFSRTRQKAGAAVRAPGAAPHPHPHPHECNYAFHETHTTCTQVCSGWRCFMKSPIAIVLAKNVTEVC